MVAGTQTVIVISPTHSCSWQAITAEITGVYLESTMWICECGTGFVMNSVMSKPQAPSKHIGTMIEEMVFVNTSIAA